ncbi:hypothetical protein 20Aug401_00042 [Pseudomonas phage 20Aug401]|uniref:Uncharacterized protein n=1 Tax=Pseudomonas phage 20Aug401 TaxID=3028482 RepID=A0AAF0JH21_9CAUD|nr:hypothetical protein 20Aug401_00042 [Pseudomonas phage 20Aug401]
MSLEDHEHAIPLHALQRIPLRRRAGGRGCLPVHRR